MRSLDYGPIHYIRRAGPASEEPKTAEEWDRFLERCLQNRQAERLEAMQLPAGASPRFPHGCYDVDLMIDGNFRIEPLAELCERSPQSFRMAPFLTLNRAPFSPKPIDGAVEFWRGPDTDNSYEVPAHHDFWRISPEGFFFTRRGYPEEGRWQGMEEGKFFDITTPTRRLGEAILQAMYIGRALSAVEASLICHCRWRGLLHRRLISAGNQNRLLTGRYETEQDGYEAIQSVVLDGLPKALPGVYTILAPLYELFDFFQLPKRLVEEELAALQANRF